MFLCKLGLYGRKQRQRDGLEVKGVWNALNEVWFVCEVERKVRGSRG